MRAWPRQQVITTHLWRELAGLFLGFPLGLRKAAAGRLMASSRQARPMFCTKVEATLPCPNLRANADLRAALLKARVAGLHTAALVIWVVAAVFLLVLAVSWAELRIRSRSSR